METTLTITEGLAELKVISKRLEEKEKAVFNYALRNESWKDPLQAHGGSVAFITQTLQSIKDLHENQIKLRRAMQLANESNEITLGTKTRSIADWLVWRRDVATQEISFLTKIKAGIDNTRIEQLKKGQKLIGPNEAASDQDVIVNLNEVDLMNWLEDAKTALERLDGQLSLKNATIAITVDF